MSKKALRSYNLADGVMLTNAELMHKYFTERKEQFQNFDAKTFHIDYDLHFLENINLAHTSDRDSVVIDEQAKETADVKIVIDECSERYSLIKYYVKKLFKDDIHTQNQFGLNDFRNVKQNPDKMIIFLDALLPKMEEHKTTLLEAGYPEAEMVEFFDIAKQLRKERVEQKDAKNVRTQKTKERVDKLNEVWEHLVEINEAAKLLFRKEPDEAKLFSLPKPPKSGATIEVVAE